jgi:putative heme iron utilization protein
MAATQEGSDHDFYKQARGLLLHARVATLATAAEGLPFAALVTPAFLDDLSPLLLLSELSTHTKQLKGNPACALLVTGQATTENPQTAPRLCLTGTASIIPGAEARAPYLATHPYAEMYVDFADFAFWRIELTSAHYIGGFAAASRLDIARLRGAIG